MLSFNILNNILFDLPYTTSGDIANRFFGYPLYEVCYAAREPHFSAGRKLIFEVHPPPGRHAGKRQIFKNEMAPIKHKAMVFGNLFFDGHILQGSINYWMSIWFQEYHFVASADMEPEYIKLERPDIVICQTIERFLDGVPQT